MTEDNRFDSAHSVLAADRYRRSRGLWRVLTFLALAVAVVAIFGRFVLMPGEAGSAHIARIVIDGAISTNAERRQLFQELAENDRVRAVLVAINSPGGTTAGGEELYEDLSALRAAKPVVAVINELGASAAYLTALGSERIFVRRLSMVGSIGVIYQHVNAGQLLDTIGIELDKVASGPLKAEPGYDEPLSGPARQSVAALVQSSFDWFVDVVAERRGLPRPRALELADGRVVTGRTGIELGLVDAVGGEAEAIAWLETERDVPGDLPLVTAWPEEGRGVGGLWGMAEARVRASLGLPSSGPVVLDGLISLWQVR